MNAFVKRLQIKGEDFQMTIFEKRISNVFARPSHSSSGSFPLCLYSMQDQCPPLHLIKKAIAQPLQGATVFVWSVSAR